MSIVQQFLRAAKRPLAATPPLGAPLRDGVRRRPATSSSSRARFLSSSGKTGPDRPSPFKRREESVLSTVTGLPHLLAAGTGAFASTLLALYLATVVESNAHALLYECSPLKYAEMDEDDLPGCLRGRELTRRSDEARRSMERERREEEERRAREESRMAMDGWVEPVGREQSGAWEAELRLEEDFERRRWVEEKSEAFGLSSRVSYSRDSSVRSHLGGGAGGGPIEARRVKEEAAKRLQERLLSAAMTA